MRERREGVGCQGGLNGGEWEWWHGFAIEWSDDDDVNPFSSIISSRD